MMLRRFFTALSAIAVCAALAAPALLCAQTKSADNSGSNSPDSAAPDLQSIYDVGKQLFDDYAPDDVKRDYEFPSQEQWDDFAARLQQAMQGGSIEEVVKYEPEVRRALAAFKMLPEYSDYVDWLTERLDLIETARMAVEAKKNATPPPLPATPHESESTATPAPGVTPSPTPATTVEPLPYYDVWVSRLKNRPLPPRADDLLPLLKVIFSAEGLPPELAWLAEVESSLNPSARSPAGARGLFQLMPATAKSLGLHLLPLDERVQPGKNARAAAVLLKKLHERFETWPLALAAYNAGEGRVASLMKKNQSTSFADVAELLPVETRMYVPKVFATVAVREKTDAVKVLGPVGMRSAPLDTAIAQSH